MMRFCGRAEPVDCVCGDLHGGVEAEGHLGLGEVVVDRLRDPDALDPVRRKPVGDAQGVLAADRDEGVESVAIDGPRDRFGPAGRLRRD